MATDPTDQTLNCAYMFYNAQTDEYYFGSTNNSERRYAEHLRDLKLRIHPNFKFQRAYDKNPNFAYYPISITTYGNSPLENRLDALAYEDALIKEHWGDPKLLNIAADALAPMLGRTHTEESKLKQSHSAKELWKDPKRVEQQSLTSTNYHANLSKEDKLVTIEKIRKANVKRFSDPKEVEKARQRSIQQWSDPELRARQSETRKAHFANGGVAYQLGTHLSEEHRASVSEGKKRYWAALPNEEKEKIKQKISEGMKKLVLVGNKSYCSRDAAAAGEGISSPSVKHRIDSPNFPDWRWG